MLVFCGLYNMYILIKTYMKKLSTDKPFYIMFIRTETKGHNNYMKRKPKGFLV